MKIIIASNNAGKIREYKQMLAGAGFDEVLSLKEAGITCEPEETGATFEENAAIKARALYEMTGCSALADDSGLMVDALGGEPGVYSARWLGLDDYALKNAEIIRRLEGKTGAERSARFVCAIHFIYVYGEKTCFREFTAKGVCEGFIGTEPRGENGFGYDPIFMYGDKSFAELSSDMKNSVSHRGNALRELEEKLKDEPDFMDETDKMFDKLIREKFDKENITSMKVIDMQKLLIELGYSEEESKRIVSRHISRLSRFRGWYD